MDFKFKEYSMENRIIKRGAEAIIYLNGSIVVKERLKKGYRIDILDRKIRKQRTKREYNLMLKAERIGVKIPKIFSMDDSKIKMEYVNGRRLKDVLDKLDKEDVKRFCILMGKYIAKLHSSDIIHGDLTTSNMIIKDNDIYFIDFGLGRVSNRVEDKATDLYLLYEALVSTHFNIHKNVWKWIVESYREHYHFAKSVLKRLEKIKRRRRYKSFSNK